MAASHPRGVVVVVPATGTASSNGYDSIQHVMTASRRSDNRQLLLADESSHLLPRRRTDHEDVELVDRAHDSIAGDHVSAHLGTTPRCQPPSPPPSPPDAAKCRRHPREFPLWRHRPRRLAAGGGRGCGGSTATARCGLLRRGTLRWAAAASLLVSLLVGVVVVIPSQHELNLAYDHHLPMWSVGKLREAQSLALQSAHFINGGGDDKEPEYWGQRAMHDLVSMGQSFSGLRSHKAGPPPRKYMEPPEGCESTVLIVRHCEKGSVREHCAHVGFERAVYLATQFGKHAAERWPSPSYIFAEGPGERRNTKKMNFREIETVGPLSEKVGVKVDDSYTTETVNDLARQILTVLQSGQMCGKMTLISWKHSNIGHLAHRLGCGPEQGCPVDYRGSDFDKAWQIKFAYRTPEHSSHKDLTLTHKPLWNIAGSVQSEGFDPLAFSKAAGDYPPGGTSWGARWEKSAVSYPERSDKNHPSQWKATRVGFTEGGGDTDPNDTNNSGGH